MLDQNGALLLESLEDELVCFGLEFVGVLGSLASSEGWWVIPEADIDTHRLVYHLELVRLLLNSLGDVDGFCVGEMVGECVKSLH